MLYKCATHPVPHSKRLKTYSVTIPSFKTFPISIFAKFFSEYDNLSKFIYLTPHAKFYLIFFFKFLKNLGFLVLETNK